MPSSPNLYVYHRGEIIPLEKAFLHISDLAVQRGYGIFDFFKIINGIPLFLDDYLARFYESARLMHLPVLLTPDELKKVLYRLMAQNQIPQSGIKMVLTGGYSEDGYTPAAPNLLITQQPITLLTAAQVQQGIQVITYSYIRDLAEAKTINYSTGIRLQPHMRAQGAQDILYHQNGIITECPRSNLFIVTHDNQVITPKKDVLKGITRKNVLEVAHQKYATVEGVVTLTDLAQAKEAFTTSTTKQILPVVQVDDQVIGNGKPGTVTLDLWQDLLSLEKQQALVRV
ncbi:aminotransferase class IV [Adhaeribacter pallidiroseus]|uniref:branched-chain-amino-acid transaminase n=1 Tax=Adhaeribacter pallidiroseus TaxID=2072847 RepID=A0A369QPG2_9BACT|nr:aminotransferase class IV [Adhaeribacter pallidiroseus]RDC65555.1 Branched-chain-amino-acid transaminase [Adhaeribacter pallidiroseus]